MGICNILFVMKCCNTSNTFFRLSNVSIIALDFRIQQPTQSYACAYHSIWWHAIILYVHAYSQLYIVPGRHIRKASIIGLIYHYESQRSTSSDHKCQHDSDKLVCTSRVLASSIHINLNFNRFIITCIEKHPPQNHGDIILQRTTSSITWDA